MQDQMDPEPPRPQTLNEVQLVNMFWFHSEPAWVLTSQLFFPRWTVFQAEVLCCVWFPVWELNWFHFRPVVGPQGAMNHVGGREEILFLFW